MATNDLFGDVVTEDRPTPIGTRQKLKAQMGYREGTKERCCKNCRHSVCFDYHDKNYYKCLLIGVSCSAATDIRLKNLCNRWESETNGIREK